MSFNTKRLLTKSRRNLEGDPYWDNTVLLLHGDGANNSQNNTFLDSSSNNFTITRNGTPSQGSFSPFALNGVAYSPTLHGGSGYFDGSGDYLDTATNASVAFGTNNFTIEFWTYINQHKTYIELLDARPNTDISSPEPVLYTDGPGILYYYVNGQDRIISSSSIPSNAWIHIALTKQGTSTRLFVNGVQTGSTYSDSVNYTHTSYRIGSARNGSSSDATNYSLNGYISNLRVTKGLAVYTSNFTPPTSPVTLLSNGGATPSTAPTAPTAGQVSLLCDFTNAGIIDHTEKNVLTTVGDAKVSTSVVKYGTGAMYFDGTGDYLTLPRSSNFDFGAGNLTFEGWINVPDISSTYKCIFSQGFPIQIYAKAGTIDAYFNDSDDSISYIVLITGPSNSVVANTWTHFAVVRNGTTFTAYVNGIAGTPATGVSQSVFYSATAPNVGYVTGGFGPYIFNGYIDDLRITKGVARYTANFTPPARAFPDK